jgi:hypothetical protein
MPGGVEKARAFFNFDHKPLPLKMLNCAEFLLAYMMACFLIWTGYANQDLPCETDLANWAMAMGLFLLFMFMSLFFLTVVAMLAEAGKANVLIMLTGGLFGLCFVACVVLFIVGQFMVWMTDRVNCSEPLYETSEGAIVISYVYIVLNVAFEVVPRYCMNKK